MISQSPPPQKSPHEHQHQALPSEVPELHRLFTEVPAVQPVLVTEGRVVVAHRAPESSEADARVVVPGGFSLTWKSW